MERPELTEEQKQELHKYRESISQEFQEAQESVVHKKRSASNELADLLDPSIRRLKHLIDSDNENISYKAATFVVTQVLGEKGVAKMSNVEEFLADMPEAHA